jgi:hypothetical protein
VTDEFRRELQINNPRASRGFRDMQDAAHRAFE